MKIDCAGANNPVYLIRNNKIWKYDADRMPVGIHHTSFRPFTIHNFEIKRAARIFLFSEGYADQSGGANGEKCIYKPFQQPLPDIHAKSMNKQREILDETIVKRMGKYEQADDIPVPGMML